MRIAGLVLLSAALLTACAEEPSLDRHAGVSGRLGDSTIGIAELERGSPLGTPQPVPKSIPDGPLAFFRELEASCSGYANLAGRGDPAHPRVEPDRWAGAVLVQEIDRDTALVEDGRGIRLVVDRWNAAGVVLPESGSPDDVMPMPYRSACPPEQFVGRRG